MENADTAQDNDSGNKKRSVTICPQCQQAIDARNVDQMMYHMVPGHKPEPRQQSN